MRKLLLTLSFAAALAVSSPILAGVIGIEAIAAIVIVLMGANYQFHTIKLIEWGFAYIA